MALKSDQLVLITGGSGFVGSHTIIQCLKAGYRVRTTVRSSKKEESVLKLLKTGDATNIDKLSFAVADLTKEEGWKEAVAGCTYVLHVASPFPPGPPKHEDDLIVPAREGTLRVLRAARDAGVKRVVVTSSFAAIGYGQAQTSVPFTEKNWTDPNHPSVRAYVKSKTLAERAAWDFIEKDGGLLELSVVNPAGIFGPVLGPETSTFGVVDVRDVVDLHLRAMTDPKAKGERFMCISPPEMSILDVSLVLRERLGAVASRSPTRVLPNFLIKIIAYFDPAAAMIAPDLGKTYNFSIDKAKNMLGWEPRSNADAVVATAESMIKLGLV